MSNNNSGLWCLSLLLCGVMFMASCGHKDLSKVKADASISAEDLFLAFTDDERRAYEEFGGKILDVEGYVVSVRKDVEGGISVQLETPDMMTDVSVDLDPAYFELAALLKEGDKVTLRAECAGIIADVILTRGAIMDYPGKN